MAFKQVVGVAMTTVVTIMMMSVLTPSTTAAFVTHSRTTAFVAATQWPSAQSAVSTTSLFAKGFGAQKEPAKQKSEAQMKRESESAKYDEISATGGQEYNVFVRQFGSDDKSWLPCGAIAVPRGAQVSDAIYANDEALREAIVRTYPKLREYKEEFEFGYNLKVYPDDPIEVAVKNAPKSSGMSVGNWLSTLFSPVDASGVKGPPRIS